jgi:3-hydroxyisobutyrate dehydrogenase-like beta-hydroxyacid dehydrogenase
VISVGIIGLGLIGRALARRLIETGDAPVVFDVRDHALDAAVADGAIAAPSSRAVAERSDVVLVCVQTDEQCADAVVGPGGVLLGAKPGTCVAVVSTVRPATIETLAAAASERGVNLVDTPIAGHGMFGVAEGTMTVIVGDDGPLVTRLEPILRRFASRVVVAGSLGSGASLKLAHNIVVYAGFAAMIEAVELARAAGVRDGLVESVAKESGALSELSAFYLPFYKQLRDEPHATDEEEVIRVAAALLEKDLADAIALADAHHVPVPLARLLSHSGRSIFQVEH